MTESRESDGGCLSALSSCFKRRGKPRQDLSESLATEVGELSASRPADYGMPPLAGPEVEPTVSLLVVSPPLPSTGIVGDPAPLAATTVLESPTIDGSSTTLDLWQEACNKLNVKTRKWIDSLPPPGNVEDPASELAELVRASEKKHEQEAFMLKVGDREIRWRDYANRVVSVVTAIGDISMNFAPAPSSAVWSAVKVLLKANVSERKDLVAIMGCTDIVLCLVRRGIVYEKVYIGNAPRPPYQEDLKKKLVEVYATCLEFLAFVYEEMQHSNLGRFLDELLDPGHGEKQVSAVKALEQELEFATRPCEAKAGDEHRKLLQSLEGPLKRVDKNVTDVLKLLDKQEREKTMKYISTIPVGLHHNEKREKRTKGTCEWLVSHSAFLEWEDSDCTSVLWLQGNIGTGKSFLSSKVIDRYRIHDKTTSQSPSEHDMGFAFFYCNISDPTRQDIHSILRSYIRQLGEVTGHPQSVHQALYNLYQRKEQIQSDITLKDCETALIEMINSYPRTILILDALDECTKDTRRQLVELFRRLVEKTKHFLKIFITSRPEYDIGGYLKSFQEERAMITINTLDNHGDIERFVNAEVDNFNTEWSAETKQLVKDILVGKSEGMFRWTYLQWEQLKEFSTNAGVTERLGKLPKTLTAAYDEIYDKYDPQGIERFMLQRAVRWVMCARQPFDSCILLSAIRVECEKMHGDKALDKSDLTDKILEAVCRHLVVKDPDLGVWKFPHASVAEYFEAKKESWVKDAQAEVTIVLINCMIDCCAVYSSVWPPSDVPESDSNLRNRTSEALDAWLMAEGADPDQPLDPRHPLQAYTQLNWFTHIHNLSDQDNRAGDVAIALKRFLGEERPQQSSREYQVFCSRIMDSTQWMYYEGMWQLVEPNTNFAFGVVAMGLHRLLPDWWNRDLDLPSSTNERGLGLLQIATYSGHYDLCQFLISQGCDINWFAEDEYDGPPLWMSVDRQEIDIMKLLLNNGANMDCVVKGRTLLCLAAEKEEFDYCRILLEMGLDPNMKCSSEFLLPCRFGCALSSAAYRGNLDAIKALVAKRADVNPENLNDEYGSPLTTAVRLGNFDSARFLLEKGADANAHLSCGQFGSPLIAAIRGEERDCVQLLLEYKADVNAKAGIGDYGSPLVAAAWVGNVDCARFLVEHGADVNAYLEFGEYGSILAAAILGASPSLDTLKLLVEEAKADLAQLAFVRPRRKEREIYTTRPKRDRIMDGARRYQLRYKHRKENMEMAAYLIQELQMEPQVLISLGVRPSDLPPDTGTMTDSENEELDEYDVYIEHGLLS